MIAACLCSDPLAPAEAERFFAQLRVPPGRRIAPLVLDRMLLACRDDRAEPPVSGGDWVVLFDGQLHNHAALAAALGQRGAGPAAVYAAALERWGEGADEHCIGHYATIAISRRSHAMRLARSPFQAPPLHFRHDGRSVTAAQRPSAVFWREQARPQPDLDRVAQTLVNDASDRFRSWYRGAFRVPLGSAVEVQAEAWRQVWHYDLFARPRQSFRDPAEYVARARELLDEGVAAALADARQPAILLSGGLDSPLVAASALRRIGPDGVLRAFTFGPSAEWTGNGPEGVFTSDFAQVRAFARMHPRLKLHFETNPGRDFRYLQRELLAASDAAPSTLGLAWIEQALYAAARDAGCDVMLCGTWGNFTFSSRGPWGFSEYLLQGRWGQLLRALHGRIGDRRPLWRKVAALSVAPLLPRWLWHAVNRARAGRHDSLRPVAIRRDWPGLQDTLRRSRAAGYDFERLHPASQRSHWRALLAEDGQEQDQYALGMELLHGLPKRDPTAYRPLVEFCWGCPTEVFLRDGVDRWLAREMAAGEMPDAQRMNRAYGHHFVDLYPRLAAARAELRAELDRMSDDPDIAAIVDLPRLRQLIEAVPDSDGGYDPDAILPYQTALPIGMAAARFIAYAKGRNDI